MTSEAERLLRAMALLSPAGVCGFLIGQRRGPRHFIESAVPAEKNISFSYSHFLQVDHLFRGRTTGFFFFGVGPAAKNRVLKPYAVGKICLEAHLEGRQKISFTAHAVEFNGQFNFAPLPLELSLERKR